MSPSDLLEDVREKEGKEMAVSLGDVVGEESLGLRSIVEGDASTIVLSARTSELGDPGRWVEPNTVMLTTGLLFVGHERDRAQALSLIHDLQQAQTVAIFFGVGVHFDQVPSALASVARAENFALYTVPADVPFYTIENFVNRSKLSAETYLLTRAAGITDDLLNSISAEQPIDALISRLASLCRGSAVLYEDSGHVVASSGKGPTHLIWAELENARAVVDRFSIGRWHVMGKPLILRGRSYRLVLASMNEATLDDLGELLLQTTLRLLRAINGVTQLALSRDKYENAQLLLALEDGISPSRERRFWERMRPFHFLAYEQVRAVALSTIDGERAEQHLVEGILEKAALQGMGLLVDENGRSSNVPTIHAIVANSTSVLAWLALAGSGLVVGASEPFNELASTPMAFREAETALEIARRRSTRSGVAARPSVVLLDEVDLASWLLARREAPQLEDKVRKFVASLGLDSSHVDTLVAYLAFDQDVARTARHLFVHSNTVRYRLGRCEEILGTRISSATTIANLYLAFQDDILALQDRLENPSS